MRHALLGHIYVGLFSDIPVNCGVFVSFCFFIFLLVVLFLF